MANVNDKDTNLQSYFSSFDEIVIQENEIVDVISILPVNKAVGPDCISHRMIKTTVIAVSKPLCILFNMSLRENKFPKFWKIAHVLPLLKKGRPIY